MKPAKESAIKPAPQAAKPPIQPFLLNYPEKVAPMIQQILMQLQNYLTKSKQPLLPGMKAPESPKPQSAAKSVKLPPRPKTPQAQSIRAKRSPIRTTQLYAESANMSRSHSHRSLTPMKRIATPDWSEADSIETSPPVVTGPPVDVVGEHRTIELYESRIQLGLDDRFRHPAQAKVAAATPMDSVMSREEYDKGERYEEKNLPARTPNFWPERLWDAEDGTMDTEKSDLLKSEIERLCALPAFERVETTKTKTEKPKIKRSTSTSTVRKPKNEVMVSLMMTPCETDESDTERDDF